VVRPALLGPVSSLPLGGGHWGGADATCRHLDLLLGNRDVTLPDALQTQFLCSTGHRLSVPTWGRRGANIEETLTYYRLPLITSI
jgi:hypothetical protein